VTIANSTRLDSGDISRATMASRPAAQAGPGGRLVLGMLVVGLLLALFAVWFQWRQTRRCLDFYGPLAARHIQSAPRVELWELDGRPDAPRRRIDITSARGLVHLRRGLVEDANFIWPAFRWSATADATAGGPAWDVALAFFESDAATEPGTLLLIDFARSPDRGGRLAVAGRPEAAGLGRLHRGLWQWIEATRIEATGLEAR
jgi:hypothetical protein